MENNISTLLKRVTLFLEDEQWQDANVYCEKVLDIDPENAQAYLGKLLAELKLHSKDELANVSKSIEQNNNYRRAIKYADEYLASELKYYNEQIQFRAEKNKQQEEVKQEAKKALHKKQAVITIAIALAAAIAAGAGYAVMRPKMQLKKAEEMIAEGQYEEAYEIIRQYDSENAEAVINAHEYNRAMAHMEQEEWEEAYEILNSLGDYGDTSNKLVEIKYQQALEVEANKNYKKAYTEFENLKTYKDSKEHSQKMHISMRRVEQHKLH